ncbi:accessory factor UbiK family protein [Enterovirga rhinocerotis]|uniref:BMFP domain-containing protein YqiC n=1 Tax=Enterovirga rhinocerotis TaxID=1339210 RepID=A0A4R7BU86_9HYPH|nr:accessory factor UbiK family protein [Enterovirga rhinocerotis]TDR89310.1 BMFP domain-containing protein YqiC [Enterovirga rhinocerotis]
MANKTLLDDFARLVTDAAGAASGVRREVETAVRTQVERLLRDMDVATREDVEVLRDLVASLRDDNARLARRLEALERQGTVNRPESNDTSFETGSKG